MNWSITIQLKKIIIDILITTYTIQWRFLFASKLNILKKKKKRSYIRAKRKNSMNALFVAAAFFSFLFSLYVLIFLIEHDEIEKITYAMLYFVPTTTTTKIMVCEIAWIVYWLQFDNNQNMFWNPMQRIMVFKANNIQHCNLKLDANGSKKEKAILNTSIEIAFFYKNVLC